jgi:hypothetical protein
MFEFEARGPTVSFFGWGFLLSELFTGDGSGSGIRLAHKARGVAIYPLVSNSFLLRFDRFCRDKWGIGSA